MPEVDRSGTLRNYYDIINMHHMLKGMNTYNLMNNKIHLTTWANFGYMAQLKCHSILVDK